MSGSRLGGLKAAETNKQKYGREFYQNIGRKGGKACVPKGFALMDIEKIKNAGRKGGKLSKRSKAKKYGDD